MSDNLQANNDLQDTYSINRSHKDCLIRLLFEDKHDLLNLYNVLNNSDYENPDDLTVYTIDNAIYISSKNDISFLVGETLNLYEHQSTVNPNMPMRGLLYFARNYESYIERNKLDIYSSVLQHFPLPQYYVFYNGTDSQPDQYVLNLSDAFPKRKGKEPAIICRATVLNINYGHNAELMSKCQKLQEYSLFIHRIRENLKLRMDTRLAVDKAIDSCIQEGVLSEILIKQRGEVREMVLSTFDQENHERILREAYIAEGQKLGEKTLLLRIIHKKIEKGKSISEIAFELEESEASIRALLDKSSDIAS